MYENKDIYIYNITFENCSYKVKRNIYDKGDYTAIKKHLSNIEWDIILSGKTVKGCVQDDDFILDKMYHILKL